VTALRATVRAAAAEAWANRSGFWTQVTAMAVNDLVWIGFWILFFDRVGDVRGWDASRVILLLAVLTTAGGIALGFLSNARRIGTLVAEGGIDAALALPVPPLAHLLVRRFDAVHLGDFGFGVVLFAVAGAPTVERTAVYVVGVAAAATVLTGFLVATGSLAFFTGRGEAGEFGLHAMLVLANYPADIFTGVAKALLFTAVPAAFVASVPAKLVDDFDAGTAALLLAVAAASAVAGWATFTFGLRRYTSGAVWTRA
jgi:ABC-2 type transport system permease protein